MPRTRQLAAIAMVAVVVLASGCAGFGTDGPADGDGEVDADDGSDEPEGADDTQDGQDDRPDGGDGASDSSDGGGDSDGAPSDSDTDSESGSDADADTGSESKADDGTKDGNEGKDSDSGGATDGSSGDGDGDAGDENSGDGEGVSSGDESDETDPSDSGDGDDDDRNGGDDEAPYGTLTVTVENDDGEPVESVEVVGIGPGGEIYSGLTDGNGQATFDLGDGAYTWYVSTDGTEYDESSEEEITMDGEDRSIALTVQSDEPDPTETHTLTVTVTDPDGEPVTDETVHVVTYPDGADVASGTTDENGTVRFDLKNGDYEIAVSASDQDLYQPSDQRLVTIDGEDEGFGVQLRSPDGDETHTLTVTIIDQTAAGPMDGTATVDGETKDVVGDEGAEFEVDDGTYTVTGEASTDGWRVGSEEVTIDGGDEEVSLPASPIRTVTVDAGEAGVDVTLVDEDGDEVDTRTTGDDGRVEFDALPGNYSLHADGYESVDVTVPADQDPRAVTMHPETVTHTLTINNAGTSTVEIERQGGPDQDPETSTHDPVGGVVEAEVEEGSYHVRTDDRNDTMVAIHVDEDTEITLQDPNPDPITIEVVDADTGEGIESAEISGVCDMWYSSGDDYITGETGPDGIAEAEPGLSPTNCNANINAEGYEEEVVQLSVPVDDGLVVELTPEQNGGGNGDVTCEDDFDSHHEAQSYFEEAPLERGHLDEDNDGVACEDHTSPDAKAIVIVEDEDGNPVAGETVMIGGESVETNEAGVASMTFDFGGESGSETVDISVRDEETTLTVENDQGGYLDEKSNIVEITVGPAGAQGSLTAVAA